MVVSLGILLGFLSGGAQDPDATDIGKALAAAALLRTEVFVTYDPSYRVLSYPGGDVPNHRGVCTDVVIRAYRKMGIDLQKLVHEDMLRAFSVYPRHWGLTKPDKNIDHRRVPNLQMFFTRHGKKLGLGRNTADYKPGDIVTWNVGAHGKIIPHIGIVTEKRSHATARPLVVHNIGSGPELEDILFDYPMTGHYRYK